MTPSQSDLFLSPSTLVADRVRADSIWSLLHMDGHRLFPDAMFADLFADRGRRSVPPHVVATVMV